MSNVVVVDPDDVRVHLTGDRAAVAITDPTISVTAEVGGGSTSPGVTDHGQLTGLDDDDHPQYLKPSEVLAGLDIAVTVGGDGSVTIASTADGALAQAGYLWESTGGNSDPGAGKVAVDVNNAQAATIMAINGTDAGGMDRQAALALLAVGDLIIIQSTTDAARSYRYSVRAAPTDQGAWWSIPVKYEIGGTSEPADDNPVTVLLVMSGVTTLTDHGGLTGLTDDDHPQYAKTDHEHSVTGQAVYAFVTTGGTPDPGTGGIGITGTGSQPRVIAISKTDADGTPRNLSPVLPGDSMVITDDPSTPPITGFARYVITDDIADLGTYWRLNALRTDTSGSTTVPAAGTRLRLILTMSSTTAGAEVNVFTGPTEPPEAREGDLWVVTDS